MERRETGAPRGKGSVGVGLSHSSEEPGEGGRKPTSGGSEGESRAGSSAEGERTCRRLSGFSVHSKVRARTRKEAERVGKYMIDPLLSLERLSFSEKEGKVCYRYGEGAEKVERMD